MPDFVIRAQVDKLARLLAIDATSLSYLERLDVSAIAALRKQLSDDLFDSLAPMFDRINKLAPLLPNALVSAVVLKAVPPEVGGRAGGAMGLAHRRRIAAVMAGLTPRYMGGAAPHVDPRVIALIVEEIPLNLLVRTAEEILNRGDYLTASEFIECAPPETTAELVRLIDNSEAMAQVLAIVCPTSKLDEIVAAVQSEDLSRVVVAAACGTKQAAQAALSVLARTQAPIAAVLVEDLFTGLDLDRINRFFLAAADGEQLRELLDVTADLTESTVSRIQLIDVVTDESFRNAIELAADTEGRRHSWKRLHSN